MLLPVVFIMAFPGEIRESRLIIHHTKYLICMLLNSMSAACLQSIWVMVYIPNNLSWASEQRFSWKVHYETKSRITVALCKINIQQGTNPRENLNEWVQNHNQCRYFHTGHKGSINNLMTLKTMLINWTCVGRMGKVPETWRFIPWKCHPSVCYATWSSGCSIGLHHMCDSEGWRLRYRCSTMEALPRHCLMADVQQQLVKSYSWVLEPGSWKRSRQKEVKSL